MLVGDAAQRGKERRVGRDESRVADHRLDDDRRDAIRVLAHQRFHCPDVVERRGERQRGERRGHTGRIGKSERRDPRAGTHEEAVGVAMIAAVELDQEIATRLRTCDAQRAHRRLGAAGDEAQHLDVRHARSHQFGQRHLERRRYAEARAVFHRLAQRIEHHRRRMAEDERPPREHVVEILVAVDVPDARPLPALDDERLAADPAERAHRRADAAGEELTRAGHERP